MQYDAKSPEDYLDQLADDWRYQTVLTLRKIIRDAAPGLTESINYKMLAYGDERHFVFHLNAQKHYVSLYAGNLSDIDPDGTLLKGLSTGKGCVRFSKTIDVSATRIDEFIQRALRRHKQGLGTGCD